MQQLCEKTEELNLSDDDRIVIFSDLHVGDRKSLDDFKGNSEILKTVLNEYYFKKGYTLILNGDVEELHRYSLHEIRKQWTDLYSIFDRFFDQGRLYKLFGNHDSKLFSLFEAQLRYPLYESLKLKYKDTNKSPNNMTSPISLLSCLFVGLGLETVTMPFLFIKSKIIYYFLILFFYSNE